MATLLPEVNQLVKSNQASLVLLSQEIGGCGSSRTRRSNKNHIELLVFFEGGWHLDLELIGQHFSKFGLEISLQSGELVSSFRNLFLSLLRFLKFRPIFTIFIFRVLLPVLLGLLDLQDFLLKSIIIDELLLSLLDLTFKILDSSLVVILLLDSRPEFTTRFTEG